MRKTTVSSTMIMIAVLFMTAWGMPLVSAVSGASSERPAISLQTDISLPANVQAEDIRFESPMFRQSSRRMKTEYQRNSASDLSEAMLQEIQQGIAEAVDDLETKRVDVNRRQRKQLTSLSDAHDNPALQALFDRRNGTPIFLKIKDPAPSSRSASTDMAAARQASRRFLTEHRKLLKINDPLTEFRLIRETHDVGGVKHLRYQQIRQDIPLWGKEISTHLDADDQVFLFNGRYLPTPPSASVEPKLTPAQARSSALAQLEMAQDAEADPEPAELVYFIPEGDDRNLRLAYKLDVVKSLTQAWTYFIDAIDGALLHRISKVQSQLTATSGRDLMGINRSFNVWAEGDYQYLIDPSIPLTRPPYSPIPNIKSSGHTYILDARNGEDELFFIRKSKSSGTWDPAGVSATHHIRRVHDYYANTFGRNGIDDQYMNYLVVVHVMRNYANAFWNGKFVVLGDGDNVMFTSLANSLDIIAHEVQHGVTQNTAGLAYENQSGALNEAYSDIFACMIDRDDWTIGEDVTLKAPGFLRNMANPAHAADPLPTKMSEYINLPNTEKGDYGGVHINMGIPSRAAYLIAEGLSAERIGQSIGREKTEKIFYHALTNLLKAYSQFVDARLLTIESARQLYGANSAEVAAVQMGWDVVEVYGEEAGTPGNQEPTSSDSISGQDLMIYLYPVDESHNPENPDEEYDLYVQTIPKPFTGYNRDLDLGPLNRLPVKYTRPAVLTLSGETLIFYIGADDNLYSVLANNTGHQQITRQGNVSSFSISPDGRYFAYTSIWTDDNHIYVGDLINNTEKKLALKPMTDLPPGMEGFINTILYADSLSFDYTGRVVVFDALNCMSTENDPCSAPNGGHRYWSIGYLDVESGAIAYPFPNQNPDIDAAYPSFAYNNNFIVVLDLIDYRQYYATGQIDSSVYTLNRQEQTVGHVVNPNFGSNNRPIYGVPSFWGDDDYVTVQAFWDANGGLARVPITSNWTGDDDNLQLINDYAAAMPLMHRAGTRELWAEIEATPASLNFGRVEAGESATMVLTLSNNSSRDISITDFQLSGAGDFRHNGKNTLLPRQRSLNVRVTFTPAQTSGSSSATLLVMSDSSVPQTGISLTGTGVAQADDSTTDGGGGGCFISGLWQSLFQTRSSGEQRP